MKGVRRQNLHFVEAYFSSYNAKVSDCKSDLKKNILDNLKSPMRISACENNQHGHLSKENVTFQI